MSKKKNPLFMIIVLLFCLLIMGGAVLFVLYLTGAFPDFNAKADKLLGLNPAETIIEVVQTDELLTPIVIDEINATQLIPYFTKDFPAIKPILFDKGNNFSEYELDFSLFNDRYSLKASGIFERLNSEYAGEEYPESTWEYHSEFPIISQPALFADSLVFIDAEPKLVQLDLKSGVVLNTQLSPAYPSKTAAIIDKNTYVFSGRDGNTYAFEFLDFVSAEEKTEEDNLKNTENLSISNLFAYDAKTTSSLQGSINSWMDSSSNFNLLPPLLLTDTQSPHSIPLTTGEVLVFVYTPQEPGTYTVGLCGENGTWIFAQGFSAVFTGHGDLQSISIDYVADRPQTTLHLSPNEFYYIAVGLFSTMGNSEISDLEDATEGTEVEDTSDSYYIMVKKTS